MNVSADGGQLYLLDCFVSLAMTVVLESLSLRASVSDAWQSSLFYVARSAQNLLSALCALLSVGAPTLPVFMHSIKTPLRWRGIGGGC